MLLVNLPPMEKKELALKLILFRLFPHQIYSFVPRHVVRPRLSPIPVAKSPRRRRIVVPSSGPSHHFSYYFFAGSATFLGIFDVVVET